MTDPYFLPGDVFLTKGSGLISRGIRFFSRSGGESRTEVNHVGIVVEAGNTRWAIMIEAIRKVTRHSFDPYTDNPKQEVAVYRPINLTVDERAAIVGKAESYVGNSYGYTKIIAHAIDYFLGGRYFARRFARMDKYPICSWVVAQSYAAAGKDFGVDAGMADPDDIWDFIVSHPDKYRVVHPLGPLN